MPQDGCRINTVRGGGCYFGPDVTEKILEKHNLQFLIRSHECKQDGYEFCHNRKVGKGDGVKDTWVYTCGCSVVACLSSVFLPMGL